MATQPVDPDEAPRFAVPVFHGEDRLCARRFSSLEAAEAYAESCTDETPGHRAVIEDILAHHVLDEEVQQDTALVEDYPHADPGASPTTPEG